MHPDVAFRAGALCAVFAFAVPSVAQTLQGQARTLGCTDTPRVVDGTNLYKCTTAGGNAAFFNVPDSAERPVPRRASAPGGASVAIGAPAVAKEPVPAAAFPRVDANTQKSRDEMRRKVLQDELATEEKLLVEARTAFNNGAPAALPEEQSQPQRYADRIARMRQAVQLHERNVEALRRELGLPR